VSNHSRPLRFGIMCTNTNFPAWEASCIRQLMTLNAAVPKLLIMDTRKSGWVAAVRQTGLNKVLGLMHRRVIALPEAMRSVDLSTELGGLKRVKCTVRLEGKYSEWFSDDDISQIREFDLDFILRFGFNIIRGDILDVPKYGVWSFHHGDEAKYRGSPPAFWEIYDGDPVTGSILQRLTDRLAGGVVLKKGFFPTTNYSYTSNLNRVLTDSAAWPAKVCTDIRNGNAQYLVGKPRKVDAPIHKLPTNRQLMIFVYITWKNLITKLLQLFFRHEEWNIGIANVPISSFVNAKTLPEIQWLPSRTQGHYVADPFGIVDGNLMVIQCEEFDYWTSRGIISKLAGQDVASIVACGPVFDMQHHLSYPYLLRHEGEHYCIPESSEARHVKLYKATPTLSRWEEVATLLSNFAAVDSTVVKHNGRWWLFCTNADDGRQDKLFLWHAETLHGPWQPHLCNPVKIDVRSARPAGTPFVHNGNLYRPSQDCSVTYGGRVSLNRVTKLTTTAFEEVVCNTIGPDVDGIYVDGMHTLSQLGEEKTLVDGKLYRFHAGGFSQALKFVVRSGYSKIGFRHNSDSG
jgi:hypothetical protein